LPDYGNRFTGERSVNWLAFAIVVVLLAAAGIGGALLFRHKSGQQAAAIRAQISLAEKENDRGRLEELYGQLLNFAPQDADALAKFAKLLAASATTNREKARALQIHERAVRENPSDIQLRESLIALALLPGFDDVCNPDPHLRSLMELKPKSADPCEKLAIRLEARGELAGPQGAEALLKEGLARDPKHVATRLRLARMLRSNLKREKEALALIEVLEKDPDLNAAGRLAFADYWQEAGDAERSWAIVAAALKAYPKDPEVLLKGAQRLELRARTAANRKEMVEQARELLRSGIAVAPNRPEFYVHLAYLDLGDNRLGDAKKIVQQGLAAVPRDFNLHWARSEVLFASFKPGDPIGEIEAALKEIREFAPAEQLVLLVEARMAFVQRRWAEAARGLEKASPLLAKDPLLSRQSLLMLGAAYRELGEPLLREMTYRNLLAGDSLNVEAYLGLGESLAEQGRFGDAVQQLAPILRQVSDADRGRLGGTLLVSLVRRETAKEPAQRQWAEVDRVLDETSRIDPGNPALVELRAERLAAEGKFAEAIAALDQFLEKNGKAAGKKAADVYKLKILLMLRKGDEAQARAALSDGRKAIGDDVALRIAEAGLEAMRGRPKDLAVLDRLVERAEHFNARERVQLFRSLAAVRHTIGDEREALNLYRRAALASPYDQGLQRTRFLLAFDLGDRKQAGEAADAMTAANFGPGSPARCARALLALEGYEQSPKPSVLRQQTVDLLGSEKFYRTWAGVPRSLARIAELEDRIRPAIEHYSAAYEQSVPNWRIARRIFALSHQIGDLVGASRWLARAELDSADESTQRAAAEVAAQVGDYRRAKAIVNKLAPEQAVDVDRALWAGGVLEVAQAHAESERMLRRAVALAPTHPRPLIALVEMLARRKRNDDARKELAEGASRLGPADRPLVMARGSEALGDVEAARRHVEAALSTSPKDLSTLRYAADFFLRQMDLPRTLELSARLQRESGASPDDVAWAARTRCLALVASGKTDEARAAMGEIGRAPGGVRSASLKQDVRTRAAILAVQRDTQSWREALKEFSRLDSLGLAEPSDQLIAAQVERNLGNWRDAKTRLVALARRAKDGRSPALVDLVRGMLAHDDPMPEIEEWLRRLPARDAETVFLHAQAIDRKNHDESAAYIAQAVNSGLIDDVAAGTMLAELKHEKLASERLAKAAGDVAKASSQAQLSAALQLIRLHVKTGATGEALALCNALRPKMNTEVYVQLVLEALYAAEGPLPQGMVQPFEAWLREQCKAKPSDRLLRLATASLESRLGRHQESVRILNALQAETPTSDPMAAAIVNNLAFLTGFAEKKFEAAERMLVEQSTSSSAPLELRDTLGVLRLELGKVDQALQDFQELAFVSPKGVVYFHLASAQAAKENLAGARSSFEQARRLGFRKSELHELERPNFDKLQARLSK
jgi:predicted Zn-dependent protease